MNPEVEAINRQKREEVEARAREKFDAFHHDIAPFKKKAIDTLKAFSPLAAIGQKLATEAATIQNPSQQIAGLVQEIFSLCNSVPMRINAALNEIYTAVPAGMDHEPYRQEKTARIIHALRCGDVGKLLETRVDQLRTEISYLASGSDGGLTEIPAAPVSSQPAKVTVNASYSPLKK